VTLGNEVAKAAVFAPLWQINKALGDLADAQEWAGDDTVAPDPVNPRAQPPCLPRASRAKGRHRRRG
jgi:hypothetical protein